MTTAEMYATCIREVGPDQLSYYRVPITDECAPGEDDFDAMVEILSPLVSKLMRNSESPAIVMNCQMGRGRTTTGMVVATLLFNAMYRRFVPLNNIPTRLNTCIQIPTRLNTCIQLG